jgi:hypothetical protein
VRAHRFGYAASNVATIAATSAGATLMVLVLSSGPLVAHHSRNAEKMFRKGFLDVIKLWLLFLSLYSLLGSRPSAYWCLQLTQIALPFLAAFGCQNITSRIL